MTTELTTFQLKASEEVANLVRNHCPNFSFSEAGDHEVFLIGEVSAMGLTIWIYEDELQFVTSLTNLLLEAPDFDTQQQMLGFFLEELGRALSSVDAND